MIVARFTGEGVLVLFVQKQIQWNICSISTLY